MPRPKCRRWVGSQPEVTFFKPRGIPLKDTEQVVVTVDEFEAMRLADLNGLYQEEAALQMDVSRPTFGRILESAHRKVADALCHGKAMRIGGGAVDVTPVRRYECSGCGHAWGIRHGTPRPSGCPSCPSVDVYRVEGRRCGPPSPRHRQRLARTKPEKEAKHEQTE